jgi:transposase
VALWSTRREPEVGQARTKYTQAYRNEAVELVISSGRPIAEIARDLGINEATLGNWVHRSRKSGKSDEKDKPLDINERAELKELREENRRLKMERDFLKKAAAWFASESKLSSPSSRMWRRRTGAGHVGSSGSR